jgi:hypothetical protein
MSGFERTLGLLTTAPLEGPVAVLLRHAERPAADLPGVDLELTERGRTRSSTLGGRLGQRVRRVAYSPVLRCQQTALAIVAGAGSPAPLIADENLGGPGLFVVDECLASSTYATFGCSEVLAALVVGHTLPGLAPPDRASVAMLEHLLAVCRDQPDGIYMFITHDSLLAPTLAWLFGPEIELPDYLDALLLWRTRDAVHARYRQRSKSLTW